MIDVICSLIAGAEAHRGLASWAQALGALLALGIAIYLPAAQHKRERALREAERRLRARSLALAIFPELLELKPRVDYLASNIGHLLAPIGGHDLREQLPKATIVLPGVTTVSIPIMHVLGDQTGGEVQQLLAVLGQYNRMLSLLQAEAIESGRLRDGYFPAETVRPHLRAAQELVDGALRLVGRIHDGEALA